MNNTYTNDDVIVRQSYVCYYDNNTSYLSDFSRNGDVDGWTYYDGIHTYGCWNNFIFATLYGDFALIGRYDPFIPFPGEDYFIISISMKLHIIDRAVGQKTPTIGKLAWRTLADPVWDEKKSVKFEVHADDKWYTYNISTADAQYWQGDILDLRIYPIFVDGRDGDEFFIRSIQIRSINKFTCDRHDCEWYQAGKYEHPCQGIGKRGFCTSAANAHTIFTVSGTEDIDFLVNIDDYGNEPVILGEFKNYTGNEVARLIERQLSSISLGGYEAAEVDFTADNRFVIRSGTPRKDSIVKVGYSKTAVALGFYDSSGNPTFTYEYGEDPASISKLASSFRLGTYAIQRLFDANGTTSVKFDPYIYNVEGGRRDWLGSKLGDTKTGLRYTIDDDYRQQTSPKYNMIDGFGQVLIDFCHPFNATGRITEIHALGSVDMGYTIVPNPHYGGWECSEEDDIGRLTAIGSKFLIFRPMKDGYLRCVAEIPLDAKDKPSETLYDRYQYTLDAECDVFVNKGDMIGIYNVKLYKGPYGDPVHTDALYYVFPGEISKEDEVYPGALYGDGTDGLMLYARSDEKQSRLILEVDLTNRINVDSLVIRGEPTTMSLEYNLMRCLDINWNVDVFGGEHITGYYNEFDAHYHFYTIPDIAYGVNRLYDGIYTVPRGQAADSWTVDVTGVVPNNPYYFWVNGDHEWIGRHYFQNPWYREQQVKGFQDDPIAFSVRFPLNRTKKIFKSKIYFKEENNFKNFALSYYVDDFYLNGDADDPHYNLIPEYTAVTLDDQRYERGSEDGDTYKEFLFSNPTIGKMQLEYVKGPGWYVPGDATLPGHASYYSAFQIKNNKSAHQAMMLNWRMLQHEWEPLDAKGFRVYTDFHYSTKIMEMEVYGFAPDLGASFVGGLFISYSLYKDYWIFPDVQENTATESIALVGDTPRYFTIDINPIVPTRFDDIILNISSDDVYIEESHCRDIVIPDNNGIGETGESKEIVIKNYYGHPYDLYVDIMKAVTDTLNVSFYNKFNGYTSLERSDKGPSVKINKSYPYFIRNDNKNVAINCDCFVLDNSVIGKQAFYSYDDGVTWSDFNGGKPLDSELIHFKNLPSGSYSILNVPVLTRNRFWRFALKCKDNNWHVREVRVYYEDEELDCIFYHDKNADVFNTPGSDTAPHLHNDSVSGSYYNVKDKQYITIDLGSPKSIDKIIIYHDSKPDWVPFAYQDTLWANAYCGIDRYATCYLLEDKPNDRVIDYSYYENTVNEYGNVKIANTFTSVSGSYMLDLADWASVAEWKAVEYCSDSRYYTIQHLTYFDWVPASGTMVSGTYQYPGYLDFSIESAYEPRFHNGIVRRTDPETEFYWAGKQMNSMQCPSIEFKFSFEITDFQSGSLDIGFIGQHRYRYRYSVGIQAMIGCSIRIQSNSTIIYLNNPDNYRYEKSVSANFGGCATNTRYYMKFTYDGDQTYTLDAWTDDFDGSSLAFSGTHTSSLTWAMSFVGMSSFVGHNPPNNCIKGKLYHFEINTDFLYDHTVMEGSTGSMQFDGQSYLSLPKISAYDLSNGRSRTWEIWMCPSKVPHAIEDVSSVKHLVAYKKIVAAAPEDGYVGWAPTFDNHSCVIVRNKGQFDLRTEDFTLDCYFRFSLFGSSNMTFFYKRNTLHFYYDVLNSKLIFESGDNKIETIWSNPSTVYHHIAISRASSNLHLFIDGAEMASNTISGTMGYYEGIDTVEGSTYYSGGDLYVGASLNNNNGLTDYFFGAMEEARFTKGLARWSSAFTPPTGKFVDDEYTKMLLRGNRDYAVILQQRAKDMEYGNDPNNQYAVLLKRSNSDPYVYTIEIVHNDSTVSNSLFYEHWCTAHRWLCVRITNNYNSSTSYHVSLHFDDLAREITVSLGNIEITGLSDLVVGKYFSGLLTSLRLTRGDKENDTSVYRYSSYSTVWPLITKTFGRLYTASLYVSDTNLVYGKYADIDLIYESQYSYYISGSRYSLWYFSILAIDLEKRYSLDFIRNYGDPAVTNLSLDVNTYYSGAETDDVYEALAPISYTEVDTDLSAQDYSVPAQWTVYDSERSNAYIFDNNLFMSVDGNNTEEDEVITTFHYNFLSDFDVWFGYELLSLTTLPWMFSAVFQDVLNDKVSVTFEIGIVTGHLTYRVKVKDNSTTDKVVFSNSSASFIRGAVRIQRVGSVFTFYVRDAETTTWTERYAYNFIYKRWNLTALSFKLTSDSPGYPYMSLNVTKFNIDFGTLRLSDPKNARWVMCTLLNGDGTSRLIEKLGVYTDVQQYLAPSGGYNNSWTSVGPAMTLYSSGNNNVAFGIHNIESSPVFGQMSTQNLVDGTAEYAFNACWGVSGDIIEPYFTLDLGKVYDIYRVVMKHGAQQSDPPNHIRETHMFTDYKIDVAETENNFTNIFDITNNIDYERTHDLATPVKARWVRVTVYKFEPGRTQVGWASDEPGAYDMFDGPALREIEVYEYYGFSILNSDDSPIVAVNMKEQFYTHSTPSGVGPWTEDKSHDWTHEADDYCYSDSVLNDPKKISFSRWGSSPDYERWVVTKDLNATDHLDGKKYLKHLKVFGDVKENPVEHAHWWGSLHSTITNGQDDTYMYCSSALKIEYPKSALEERVYFIEGDDFGIDEKCSWRDGFSFRWYISDYDAIDWTYGKLRFGGLDGTSVHAPVYYEWYLTTISGELHTGWNDLFFSLQAADNVEYNATIGALDIDPRTPKAIQSNKIELQFKGNNTNDIVFEIDGFVIVRNTFESSLNAEPALYLNENDSVAIKLSNVSLSAGAVSMWLRPDTYLDGTDIFGCTSPRNIFSLSSTTGDVFGAALTPEGFLIYYGNTTNVSFRRAFVEMDDYTYLGIDEPWHFGIAFSNNGKGIDSSGAAIKLFINGVNLFTSFDTWEYEDDKFFNFILGGTGPFGAFVDLSSFPKSISSILSQVKVYGYAKTDFYKDMRDFEGLYVEGVATSDLIEISKDNVTFYNVDSPYLPLVFEQVPSGDSISVYVRVVLPEEIRFVTTIATRTVKLLTQWDIGV